MIFPVQRSEEDTAIERVVLREDRFTTAAFSSYDGVDYFRLEIRFDDGGVLTVSDANA